MSARDPLVVFVDSFPELSETFVFGELRALRALGHEVRVEATRRAASVAPVDASELPEARYLTEGSRGERVAALAWAWRSHPLGVLRDLVLRWRWRREEQVRPLRAIAVVARQLRERHMHVHFAAGACLDAMRISLLTGVPYSVTAHAYDLFQHPRNLAEKLRRARLVVTVCEYNARHLRAACGVDPEVVVMGVDPDRFARRRPDASGGGVLAVGRLVEKKGFEHLAAAAAQLGPGVAVRIVGEGPLRERLAAAGTVELLGARPPEEVRALLEEADVLAAPSVVARDGDRDSMPVVVKEALAMEVPVVASDEVGLPEMVRPQWGRLVPPGDADALAAAIAELLALPAEERRAMGRAGRAWVVEHCNLMRETARLSELIANAAGEPVTAGAAERDGA